MALIVTTMTLEQQQIGWMTEQTKGKSNMHKLLDQIENVGRIVILLAIPLIFHLQSGSRRDMDVLTAAIEKPAIKLAPVYAALPPRVANVGRVGYSVIGKRGERGKTKNRFDFAHHSQFRKNCVYLPH